MSVRWWPFIHQVPGTCLNFPYICFWGFGLGVPTYQKKRSTHRPFGRSSLKDPTVGFCCESRPCAQDSCQIWMKVDHNMIFVIHGLYAPNMPHAPMLHLPTVAFPNSWTSAIPTLPLRRVRDWRPEGPHQVQVPGHPRRFDPCRKTPHGHDVAVLLFLMIYITII